MAGRKRVSGRDTQAMRSLRLSGLRGGTGTPGVHLLISGRERPTLSLCPCENGSSCTQGYCQRQADRAIAVKSRRSNGPAEPARPQIGGTATKWRDRSREGPGYCKGCLEKQQKIDRLVEEVRQVKAKLRYQERTAKEGPFGSSTPSSFQNSTEGQQP